MLILDGKVVAEVNDTSTAKALESITTILGNTDANIAALKKLTSDDITIVTAINQLYNMLNGITFSINKTNNCLSASYDDGT